MLAERYKTRTGALSTVSQMHIQDKCVFSQRTVGMPDKAYAKQEGGGQEREHQAGNAMTSKQANIRMILDRANSLTQVCFWPLLMLCGCMHHEQEQRCNQVVHAPLWGVCTITGHMHHSRIYAPQLHTLLHSHADCTKDAIMTRSDCILQYFTMTTNATIPRDSR